MHIDCGFVGWWCPDLLALHQDCTCKKHMPVHLTHVFAASASARESRVRQVGIGCVSCVCVCVCVCVCQMNLCVACQGIFSRQVVAQIFQYRVRFCPCCMSMFNDGSSNFVRISLFLWLVFAFRAQTHARAHKYIFHFSLLPRPHTFAA